MISFKEFLMDFKADFLSMRSNTVVDKQLRVLQYNAEGRAKKKNCFEIARPGGK